MEPTFDRSNSEIKWGDEIPFDGSPLPAAPRTGPGAFRPGDHVRSIASRGKAKRRQFGVMVINEDGTLHLWAHRWGHIYNADPEKWERTPRNEEVDNA